MSAPTPLRDAVVEEFDGLLALGFDVGDVLLALGRGYEQTRRLVAHSGRADLIEAMSEWRQGDAERLRRARGLAWK